jgi:hypothetical protein
VYRTTTGTNWYSKSPTKIRQEDKKNKKKERKKRRKKEEEEERLLPLKM